MATQKKTKQAVVQAIGGPADGYFYQLEVSGMGTLGFFSECQNVGFTHEVLQYKDGDELLIRKSPGRYRTKGLVFSRPFDGDMAIWEWYRQIQNGVVDRRDASLVAYDETSAETARWSIYNAWPSRLVTEYDPAGNGYEVFVLTFEIIERVS